MARPPAGSDLEGMYTPTVPRVRDRPAAYGPHEVGGGAFPAAHVLEDLNRCPDGHAPRILARYAALRCWILRDDRADPAFVDHAAGSARRYLDAVAGWPEAEPLRRLTGAEPGLDAAHRAASLARAAGHLDGASALLRAGYMAARRRGEIAWAARMAGAVADLLEREGLEGAGLWARRADRLRRYSDA